MIDLVLDGDLTAHLSVPLVLEYEEVMLREADVLSVTTREFRIVVAAFVEQATEHANAFATHILHMPDSDTASHELVPTEDGARVPVDSALSEFVESARQQVKDDEKNTARTYRLSCGRFTRSGSADAFVLAVVIGLIGIVSSTGCATSSQSAESSPFAHSRLGEYAPSDVPYDTVYTSKTADTPPELIGGLQGLFEKVEYPQRAKQNGISGKVLIGLIVRPDGGVSNLQVVERAHPLLDREAKRVVRQTRFEPGLKSGTAVPVKAVMPIAFQVKTQTSP